MGGGRNKSKKFLKQKQAKQKKRPPQKVKHVGGKSGKKSDAGGGSVPGLTRDDLANLSNSDIHFHKSQFDDDLDDMSDNISLVSELTIAADEYLNANEQQAAYNELDEHFDNLAEKDAIMRMSALTTINHALRRRNFDDYLRAKQCDKLQTLIVYLRDSLRTARGGAKEQCLALDTCALVMLTLQSNHDMFEKQLRPIIMKFIQRPHSRHVQIKSIEVWTCMTWVLNDNEKTLKTIDLLDDIWMKRLSKKRLKIKFKELKKLKEENAAENDQNDTNTTQDTDDTDEVELLPNKSTNSKDATYMKDNDSDSDFDDDIDTDNTTNDNNDTEEKKDDNDNDESSNIPSSPQFTASQTDLLNKLESTKIMPDNVVVTAITNWIWLIASIGNETAIGSLLEVYNLDFLDILEHNKNVDVRCAAGQALTLLISNYKKAHNYGNGNKNGKNGKNNGDFDFDDILSFFYEFLDETDIRRKKELKLQKHKFREYLRTLEDKWTPMIKIKLRGQTHELDGWCKWIQYHCLKTILKSGFQPHLLENAMIQAAFDMENVEAPQPLTQLEKKSKLMVHADNAKQQKTKIKGQRAVKQAFMFNHDAE